MFSLENIIIRQANTSDYDDFLTVFSEVEKLHRENLPWKFQKTEVLFAVSDYQEMINDPHAKVSLAYDENKIVGFSIAYMRQNKEIPIFQKKNLY
ncbi:hypothetical protein IJM86_06585 [bacterium]|nr:hypothetical protein [bacterium]